MSLYNNVYFGFAQMCRKRDFSGSAVVIRLFVVVIHRRP